MSASCQRPTSSTDSSPRSPDTAVGDVPSRSDLRRPADALTIAAVPDPDRTIDPERILMGPGPGNPHPCVIAALTEPMVGHLDPEFLHTLDETNARPVSYTHLTLPTTPYV